MLAGFFLLYEVNDMKLVLIGFMGSGKTTVGQLLAQKLESEVIDLDVEICQQEEKSINEIFATHGEQYFRQVEHDLLVTNMNKDNVILATGGGTPLREDNARQLMNASVPVILLQASPEVTYQRLKGDSSRPLAKGLNVSELGAIKAQRASKYIACADFEINTDHLSPQEVVTQIEEILANWQVA